MTSWKSALAFACAALTAAPAAYADASTDDAHHMHLYHDVKLGPVSPEARRAVREVIQSCAFSMMARIGPSPRDRARCDHAAEQASKLPDAARASLLALESTETGNTARYRLYDVVARSGDLELAEPLAKAFGRLRQDRMFMMGDEAYPIEHTLAALTYAQVDERAPWERHERTNRERSDEWTAFLAAHRGQTREQLRAARESDARAHAADRDAGRAYFAAGFLASQPDTRAEGRTALEQLLARADLPPAARATIQSAIGSVAAPPQAALKVRS